MDGRKIAGIKRSKLFNEIVEERVSKRLEEKLKHMEYKKVISVPIKVASEVRRIDTFVELSRIADVMHAISETEIGMIFGNRIELHKKKDLIEVHIDKLQVKKRKWRN